MLTHIRRSISRRNYLSVAGLPVPTISHRSSRPSRSRATRAGLTCAHVFNRYGVQCVCVRVQRRCAQHNCTPFSNEDKVAQFTVLLRQAHRRVVGSLVSLVLRQCVYCVCGFRYTNTLTHRRARTHECTNARAPCSQQQRSRTYTAYMRMCMHVGVHGAPAITARTAQARVIINDVMCDLWIIHVRINIEEASNDDFGHTLEHVTAVWRWWW